MKEEEILKERALKCGDENLEERNNYIDKDDNEMSFYNPKSKWDWYSIGGRWNGMLKLKNGENVDSAMVKDIDFGQNIDVDSFSKDIDVINRYNILCEKGEFIYSGDYYKKVYPTIEDYIKITNTFSTYAIITETGEWHEKGEMYYFGMTGATEKEEKEWGLSYYDNFIKNLKEEWFITVVDCHI